MKKIGLRLALMILAAIVILFCGVTYSGATDDLQLSGYVKDVNLSAKTVIVDVRSTACKGQKRFMVMDPKLLGTLESQVGYWITFSINSDNCKGNAVYTMSKATFNKKRSIEQ